MDLSGFPDLLDKAFLEYRIKQTRQRLSVSLNSFASFLDFSPPIVNMWLSGNRLPSQANVERLIPKMVELLDLEVYDILGLPRPDQNLQRLTQAWPHIPVPFQQMLAEQAEKYAAEGEKPANEKADVEIVQKNAIGENVDLVSKKSDVA
jgi:transcriptional regulator with XRE-family HTH domain